jgi:hypothetical protein
MRFPIWGSNDILPYAHADIAKVFEGYYGDIFAYDFRTKKSTREIQGPVNGPLNLLPNSAYMAFYKDYALFIWDFKRQVMIPIVGGTPMRSATVVGWLMN